MFSADADAFFEQPNRIRKPPSVFGVLYLLRRDIFLCMGQNPNTGHPIPYAALWPGVMAILAGVDLLGKFYTGNDQIRKAGNRFRNFIHEYFKPISADDEETIYQLRNALLHSFGLYSETHNKKYHFVLGQNLGNFITSPNADDYIIDIREFHRRFEAAISKYQTDVDNCALLQTHFKNMFPKYGVINIG